MYNFLNFPTVVSVLSGIVRKVFKKSNNDFLHGSNLIPKRVRLTPMFATSSAILKHLEAFSEEVPKATFV